MDRLHDLEHATAAQFTRSEPPENSFKLYHYHPTEVGAIIFVLLFLATTVAHTWQLFRYRVWFVLPLIIGGIRTYFLRSGFSRPSEPRIKIFEKLT
jgi:hypothetical protein